MTIKADTLRKLADASPWPGNRYGELGEEGMIRGWEEAGMTRHLIHRAFTETQAMNICADAPNPSRELERTFYRGQEKLYLKADVYQSVDGSRLADAAIARIKEDDPLAAADYQALLEGQGAQGLFQQLDIDARRAQLALEAKAARADNDLADPDEFRARQSQGRRM